MVKVLLLELLLFAEGYSTWINYNLDGQKFLTSEDVTLRQRTYHHQAKVMIQSFHTCQYNFFFFLSNPFLLFKKLPNKTYKTFG